MCRHRHTDVVAGLRNPVVKSRLGEMVCRCRCDKQKYRLGLAAIVFLQTKADVVDRLILPRCAPVGVPKGEKRPDLLEVPIKRLSAFERVTPDRDLGTL